MKRQRPTMSAYGIALAEAAAIRSEDPYVSVGAVMMRSDWSIASIGYNGTAPGVTLPDHVWADRDKRRPYMIHAEVNALRYCTKDDADGGLLFVTGTPCLSCIAICSAHGISAILFRDELETYPLGPALDLAAHMNITLVKLEGTSHDRLV